MGHEEEVLKIGKKLDKMVAKKTTESAAEALRALQRIPMTLETLQKTRIGMSVNSVRKQTTSEEVASVAKQLIKGWKKLVPEAPAKKPESSRKNPKEELSSKKKKVKEGSPEQEEESSAVARVSANNNGMGFESTIASTNNPIRDKCREMLVRGLETEGGIQLTHEGHDCEERNYHVSVISASESMKSRCRFLAAMIEEAIHQEFRDVGMKYKNRVRSRYSNLKDAKNPELKENVLKGVISPEKLAKMTPEEMASSEMKRVREKFEEENIKDHQMAMNEGTKTDMFTCGKCKGRACTYNQLQTRSADEPMTTFVFCTECGNRWKFC